MNILTNLDLKQNQIMNGALHKLGSAPANPVKGQVYFNTTAGINRAFVYNGTEWIGMDALSASMTGSDIVGAINESTSIIDNDNLSIEVNDAITKTHTHTNKTILDNTTASFKEAQETKLGHISIDSALDLNSMSDSIALNTAKVSNATHTGDVTGSVELTIENKAVSNTKLADMGVGTIKGRVTTAGVPQDLTSSEVRTLLNVEDGAQVNTVTQVAGKTGSVTVTKSDVGLGNVTNDAQVKKLTNSVSGNVPAWDGTTGDKLSTGYGVETTLAGSSSKLPRADAVKTYIDNLLSANDAMVYKGTIGVGGTVTALPTTHSAGWSYKVITPATYAGHACEIGDLIIAVQNRTGSGNVNTDWTVVQSNLDGAVVGPVSATNGNIPLFDGTTGKLLKNSSVNPSSFATAGHNHDTIYPKKYTTTLGGSTSQVVTHNLGTRDLTIMIRETASPYAQVITDVEFTTINTITVRFAVAPSAGQYTITVVG